MSDNQRHWGTGAARRAAGSEASCRVLVPFCSIALQHAQTAIGSRPTGKDACTQSYATEAMLAPARAPTWNSGELGQPSVVLHPSAESQ